MNLEKTAFLWKSLAMGIILLFFGMAWAPVITVQAVMVSQDDDFREVTTQVCGIKGYKDTKVKLTKEQYQNLQQYLVEFRARLNQTTTREEAVPIFQDAMVELDTYGLLPAGMSIEQAQRLITLENRMQLNANFIKKSISESINFLCFFTAVTNNVIDLNFWLLLYFLTSQYIPYDSPFVLLYTFFYLVGFFKPLCFLNFLSVGYDGEFTFYSSVGLKGIKSGMGDVSTVIGFTGLKIWFTPSNAFYLGFALSVND